MSKWIELRVLVLGTTYPAYSKKYDELACTGAIREDSLEMVRFPVPYRYLEEGKRFKAFQWIKAKFAKHLSDPRTESLLIQQESIELQERIPASRSDERVHFLENSPNLVKSVDELKLRQKEDGLSLGIIKPKRILGCSLEERSEAARQEWIEKEEMILRQQSLFGKIKPLDFPETRFKVRWSCDDPSCDCPRNMALRHWGLHELNRKYRDYPDREEKVRGAMYEQLDQNEKDVYLFLGNFRGIQYNFGLMGSYSAPRVRQTSLLNL